MPDVYQHLILGTIDIHPPASFLLLINWQPLSAWALVLRRGSDIRGERERTRASETETETVSVFVWVGGWLCMKRLD
jgi:hypothetical protein